MDSEIVQDKDCRNVKVKLYPNASQREVLARWQGIAVFVWNLCLEQREDYARKRRLFGTDVYRTTKAPNYFSQGPELTAAKEFAPWIREAPADMLGTVMRTLDRAYQGFFKSLTKPGKIKVGRPRFKRRSDSISLKLRGFKSAHFVVHGRSLRVKFGNGLGWVKARGNLDLRGGKVATIALKREFDGWYATICVTSPAVHREPTGIGSVGVDLGIAQTVTLSTGQHYNLPEKMKRLMDRKKVLQRRMKRKKRGSANSRKAYARIAKLDAVVARMRNSFAHEVSTDVARRFDTVVVEDLNLTKMTKSAKGTAEAPGKNVAAKSGLNRELLNSGLGMIRVKLEEKSKKFGAQFVKVCPKYTSQACNSCGHVSIHNRKTQESFACVKCGHTDNADVNAAKNIRDKGIESTTAKKAA